MLDEHLAQEAAQKGLYNPQNEHDACGVGLLVNIKGSKSHDLVEHALKVLEHMVHRGAERPDQTGDGAGIQVQIPHEFFLGQGIDLPCPGEYGVGIVFLPKEQDDADAIMALLNRIAEEQGLGVIATRVVPTCPYVLGRDAQLSEPLICQVFVKAVKESKLPLELRLYLLRKKLEQMMLKADVKGKKDFYVVSLSSRTLVYKGMLSSTQLRTYYPDLMHPDFESGIALVHSRFSTNTFPTWSLAQPFRFIGHNGEINTIRGNRRWMEARESVLMPDQFKLEDVLPILQPGMSDSASLDNVLEFFVMAGMSLPHALSMMVPESFNKKNPISPALKAFYEYHSILMAAWDGPATLLFSDGRYAGGMLDRNGLRPARYVITNHDTLVIASETGVLNLETNNVTKRGRLRPGKMIMVDTHEGKILFDEEIKDALSKEYPYGDWLQMNRINLADVSSGRKVENGVPELAQRMRDFGFTKEDVDKVMMPMLVNSQEATSSMGNDMPLAAFSERPQLIFNYFRQQFAQVTNPPIDPIREELVMSLSSYIGVVGQNILKANPGLCKMVKMNNPILTNKELDLLRNLAYKGFRTKTIDLTFDIPAKGNPLPVEIQRVCTEALEAVEDGVNYVILSDKNLSDSRLAIPSLLATSAVHNFLIEKRRRVQTAIVVEAGDVREVMHFALLMGYGASAVNPYMALAIIDDLIKSKQLQLDFSTAEKHYIKAVDKGLLKILSRMGISTMGSYKGGQLFEALGLDEDVLTKYFGGTHSAFSGVSLKRIYDDMLRFRKADETELPKEAHAWTPAMVKLLHQAVEENSMDKYLEFARQSDEKEHPIFIRDFLQIKENKAIESVESVESIMHRFVAGAISFGAVSKEAHEAIAMAMNHVGGRSNTGEGGEDPARFVTNTRSAIKQVASGRFGVTAEYLMNADEIQIKVAQGAKPGEGGHLPGYKVDEVIARVRHAIPGTTLISPPPHHDIYSIEDLAQLIFDLKTLNPQAAVSVKLVAESGVGTVAAGVAKSKADIIVISGACGGTGASPLSSIRYAGMPLEMGLAEVQQTLLLNGLRGQVTLQADGQIKTGRDIIVAALLGAEEFAFSTSLMIAEGCMMCRSCHTNKCPQGIATQDAEKRSRFCKGTSDPTAEAARRIENYLRFLAEDVRRYLAAMGFAKLEDIVGRVDLLSQKNNDFDFSRIVYAPLNVSPLHRVTDDWNSIVPGNLLNVRMATEARAAIEEKLPVYLMHEVKNTFRAVGTNLAGLVAARYGSEGLPDNTLNVMFQGSAGQSFGAFLTRGMQFRLEGDANDYVGKGLSGGRIVIVPPTGYLFEPENNIIAGNTLLYGATSGELYANGRVGERFCVRNSGATAVVEGAGDHCCEYMTGGKVVVLGPVGRNFAAGMSGGVAYVWNPNADFDFYCNMEMVELTLVEQKADLEELCDLLERHVRYTDSPLAKRMLANWAHFKSEFIKVTPTEYRVLLERQSAPLLAE